MSLISFLKSYADLFKPKPFTGFLKDPRTEVERLSDYRHEELASAVPLKWIEKTEYKAYPIRDQDGSSSCIGQGCAKALTVTTGVIQSAHPIYRMRENFPAPGMWLQDAGRVVKNFGTTTEALDPSQNMSEELLSQPVTVETPLKRLYIFVRPKDIDDIASAIEQFGAVPLTFHFNFAEWKDIPVYNGKDANVGHCVCAVDYFIYNGEKCILIEDSWGHATSIGNGGQRIITESYLKARCDDGMYFLKDSNDVVKKPKYKFTKNLSYGMTNKDVAALQDILKYEGFFLKTIPSTGKYLNITKDGVLAFQLKYGVDTLENLKKLNGTIVGAKTRAQLNKLYS